MLGVKPNERFKIKNCRCELDKDDNEYWIESNLEIRDSEGRSCLDCLLRALLCREYKIIKNPKPTKEDKIIIDYAKLCGCKWLAVDENGALFGFFGKPERADSIFIGRGDTSIHHSLSFLTWEDEPYYIGGVMNSDIRRYIERNLAMAKNGREQRQLLRRKSHKCL